MRSAFERSSTAMNQFCTPRWLTLWAALLLGGCTYHSKANVSPSSMTVTSYYPISHEVKRSKVPQLQSHGTPQAGFLRSADRLNANEHCTVRRKTNYGASDTINAIKTALRAVHAAHERTPRIHVGDISLKHGGPLQGHRSHQNGLDVDLSYYLKTNHDEDEFKRATPETIDVARTWTLLRSLIADNRIQFIFIDHALQKPIYEYARDEVGLSTQFLMATFSYPHSRHAKKGIIRHWDAHTDHMHIRFLPRLTRPDFSPSSHDYARRYRR